MATKNEVEQKILDKMSDYLDGDVDAENLMMISRAYEKMRLVGPPSGNIIIAIDEGSGNEYVFNIPDYNEYRHGDTILFSATHSNTSNAIAVVGSLEGRPIYKDDNSELSANDIKSSRIIMMSYNSNTNAWYILSNSSLGGGGSSPSTSIIRNTVLSGAVDSSGNPTFLEIGTGLSINLLAGTKPLILTMAKGYSSTGPVDQILTVNEDVSNAWTDLADNSWSYLFIDIENGSITYGHTTVEPRIVHQLNSSPVHLLHNFLVPEMKMWHYNSISEVWEEKTRVLVGECQTASGSVTILETYPILKNWFGPSLLHKSYQLTDSNMVAINLHLADRFKLTLGPASSRELALYHPVEGGSYTIELIQGAEGPFTISNYLLFDASGNMGSAVKWKGGALPILSSTAGMVDILYVNYTNNTYIINYDIGFAEII